MRNQERSSSEGQAKQIRADSRQNLVGKTPTIAPLRKIHTALLNGFLDKYQDSTPSVALMHSIEGAIPVLSSFLENFNPEKATQDQHKFLKALYLSISIDTMESFGLNMLTPLTPTRLNRIFKSIIEPKEMPRAISLNARNKISLEVRNGLISVLGEGASKELSKEYHRIFKSKIELAHKTKSILGANNISTWDEVVAATSPMAAIRFMRNEAEKLAEGSKYNSSKSSNLAELDEITHLFRQHFQREYLDNHNKDIRIALLERGINFSANLLRQSLKYQGYKNITLVDSESLSKEIISDQIAPSLFTLLYDASKDNETFSRLIEELYEAYGSISDNFIDQVWSYLELESTNEEVSIFVRAKLAVGLYLISAKKDPRPPWLTDCREHAQDLLGQLYDTGNKRNAQRLFNKIEAIT